MSRDRDGKQLVVDQYPVSNYQTYSQNYNGSSQIQGVSQKKNGTDTGRLNRLASREQQSRRLVGGDFNMDSAYSSA